MGLTLFFCSSTAQDEGLTWTEPVLTPMWSVWPQIRRLPNGVLVVSSGRPSIGIWWCGDQIGETWSFQNLPAKHNELLPDMPQWHYNALDVACDKMPCATCWTHQCTVETTSYTGMAIVDSSPDQRNTTVLISYDRLANGWAGPPGPNGKADVVFSVRLHLDLSDTPQPPPPPPKPLPPPRPLDPPPK